MRRARPLAQARVVEQAFGGFGAGAVVEHADDGGHRGACRVLSAPSKKAMSFGQASAETSGS